MEKLTPEQIKKLQAPLPDWALSPHPTKKAADKTPMTVINPMAVIDRLNEVFGVGQWNFHTEHIDHQAFIQKTKNGEREMFRGLVKGILVFFYEEDQPPLTLEQYGGSSNDDLGDAMKGSATDALTKIASYLGIGASIYKGQGNAMPKMTQDEAFLALRTATTYDELKSLFIALPPSLRKDPEVIALKDELKETIVN